MRKIIVIGGGASGMMAAYTASKNNKQVILLEKNEKLGKKIYITGKGRCNLCPNVDKNEFILNITTNPKFLYGAINALPPQKLMGIFEMNGLSLKTERGNRVFPSSNKASDVTKTLEKLLVKQGVDIRLNTVAKGIVVNDCKIVGVKVETGIIECDSVIICCGGISYPLTGSTGDGYLFAQELGHAVVDLKPALTGIELCGNDFLQMQGVSLKNVAITVKNEDKVIYNDFGEMLFTHFGVSGPIILSCSSIINKKRLDNLYLYLDLKPALNEETLSQRLIKVFAENKSKNLFYSMRSLLPKSVIDTVLRQASVNKDKKCSDITVEERNRIVFSLKNFKFKIKGLRPINEAIVTSGGVSVKEINPKTMGSKLVDGLYFAGEVIDVDAFTGGYNLQIAWATGYVAGENC